MPTGCREHRETKPFENEGRDNTLDPHYNPAVKPSFVYLQCQSAQWLKLMFFSFFFFFVLMEINPKQINFPRAPHPGSQLPWISNVVACSEIKVMMRRQGQIKDTQFRATSSSWGAPWSFLTYIFLTHVRWRNGAAVHRFSIICFSGWDMGTESNSNQRSDRLPLPSPLSRYLTNSHSSAPLALQPK